MTEQMEGLTPQEIEANYFNATYDDLAIEVVSSATPINFGVGEMPPRAMCEKACKILKVDGFSLFDAVDFEGVYEKGDAPTVLAHGFIAVLRRELFEQANKRGIGEDHINLPAEANSDYWQRRLMDRWRSLRNGGEVEHTWLN